MKTLLIALSAAFACVAAEASLFTDAEIVARNRAKCLTARQVASFDEDEVLARLRRAQVDFAEREGFVLCENAGMPTTEICWDVCRDAKDVLHVSLYFHDLGKGEGAGDQNSVEVAFAPYGDCHAYLQAGVTAKSLWKSCYWPYRDGRENLEKRFRRECTVSFAKGTGSSLSERSVNDRLVTFHVPVAVVCAPESKGLIGFNMMRCNLTAGENATWNPTCGAAFPDASGFGFLRLDDKAPQPPAPAEAKPLAGKVQLQIEYDWPDEMVGGPYSPETLKAELAMLKRQGVGRVYWIFYPEFGVFGGMISENMARTTELFKGEDVTKAACRLAHEVGLEFFVTVKPYDLFRNAFCRANGARFGVRRNPAWTDPQGPKTVKKLVLARDGDAPFEFDPAAVKVSTSADNLTYAPATGFAVADEVLEYPNTEWTPNGNRPTGGTHKVRALVFTGIPGACEYVAFEFPKGAWSFGNLRYELVTVETDRGKVRGMCSALRNKPSPNGFLPSGKGVFEFVHDGAAAGWADLTESMDREYGFSAGGSFAVKLSEIATRDDVLDPTFPEVRQYWCDYFVKSAIVYGADGLDVRVANHRVASDWLAYCYAEPVMKAFRAKYGREPACTPADYEAVRRIRGEGHTQFLREAAALLHAAGRKLEAHVEARMKAPPSVDAYQGIHFDWATWIDEGIVDGVNLKYLGPFNRFVDAEIMPRARRRGIPVNQIAAYGDPRRFGRTWEEAYCGMENCRLGGVNGFNLYETWVYFRTLPTGERMVRGCGLQILKTLKPLAR